MAEKKTREDFQREEQLQARHDLLDAGNRGGRSLLTGRETSTRHSEYHAEVGRAYREGDEWKPRAPYFGFSLHPLFVIALIAVFILVAMIL